MTKLPKTFIELKEKYPEVYSSHEAMAEAAISAGPLSPREIALVRLATACGANLEGGVRAHSRRGLDAGLLPDEIRHTVLLGVTTLGFPTMMANLSRANDVLASREESDQCCKT